MVCFNINVNLPVEGVNPFDKSYKHSEVKSILNTQKSLKENLNLWLRQAGLISQEGDMNEENFYVVIGNSIITSLN